jgi:hypothetical protein
MDLATLKMFENQAKGATIHGCRVNLDRNRGFAQNAKARIGIRRAGQKRRTRQRLRRKSTALNGVKIL